MPDTPRKRGLSPNLTSDTCQLTFCRLPDIFSAMANTEFIHPGLIVRQNCLERFNLSVTEAASALGVSRQALTNLLSGKASISPEMALRLDMAFGGGAETWLQRQLLHDLAKARLRLNDLSNVRMVTEQQPGLF
ncbi:MAG TPA: HigA family addiction module antitoxin [Pararobbsia sp.]|nr:HigA family addiction module antitoxin [Pararobbsia sp.]